MSVQLQEQFGTPLIQLVFAQLAFTDSTVNNAQLQDSGMKNRMLAFALPQELSGTQPIRHATAHQACMDLNV